MTRKTTTPKPLFWPLPTTPQFDLTSLSRVWCGVCGRRFLDHDLGQYLFCEQLGTRFAEGVYLPLLHGEKRSGRLLWASARRIWTVFLKNNPHYRYRRRFPFKEAKLKGFPNLFKGF